MAAACAYRGEALRQLMLIPPFRGKAEVLQGLELLQRELDLGRVRLEHQARLEARLRHGVAQAALVLVEREPRRLGELRELAHVAPQPADAHLVAAARSTLSSPL